MTLKGVVLRATPFKVFDRMHHLFGNPGNSVGWFN